MRDRREEDLLWIIDCATFRRASRCFLDETSVSCLRVRRVMVCSMKGISERERERERQTEDGEKREEEPREGLGSLGLFNKK